MRKPGYISLIAVIVSILGFTTISFERMSKNAEKANNSSSSGNKNSAAQAEKKSFTWD